MLTQRHLDQIEIGALGSPQSFAVEYDGLLDIDVLGEAYRVLCARHPVLRARVRVDRSGHILYVEPTHYPDLVTRDGGEAELEDLFNEPLDPHDKVAGMTVIRRGTSGFVVMRFDHAVGDARCWIALQDELWRIYTDVVRGVDFGGWKRPAPKVACEPIHGSFRCSTVVCADVVGCTGATRDIENDTPPDPLER